MKSEKASAPAPTAESYPELKPDIPDTRKVSKAKKPMLMNLLDQKPSGTVGENVRAGKPDKAKQIIAQRMAQQWTQKKPNLPDIKKMMEMFKDDGFAFSEEGQKVLNEMRKRFEKACKMKKAHLDDPKEPELFKNYDELAASLAGWQPSLKKKDDWKISRGPHANSKVYEHPSHGKVVERGGEFHVVPHGKEYITSTHPTLGDAKEALQKPQK